MTQTKYLYMAENSEGKRYWFEGDSDVYAIRTIKATEIKPGQSIKLWRISELQIQPEGTVPDEFFTKVTGKVEQSGMLIFHGEEK